MHCYISSVISKFFFQVSILVIFGLSRSVLTSYRPTRLVSWQLFRRRISPWECTPICILYIWQITEWCRHAYPIGKRICHIRISI